LFGGKWVELEIIVLSEISQSCKDKNCMFFLICRSQGKTKHLKSESKSRTISEVERERKRERKEEQLPQAHMARQRSAPRPKRATSVTPLTSRVACWTSWSSGWKL
jgi:hypothetical protein